jgi:hypothetical protein
MSLSITLDWISFTFKEYTHEAEQWISDYASLESVVPTTPRNGYSEACQDKNGILRMWNYAREEMGNHVIISGSTLQNILEHYAIDQQTLLGSIVNAGGSITRLDLATDAKNEQVDYADIWARLERRDYIGNAQKTAILRGSDGGTTIYIGSRTSERFLRLYDKAIQSGNSSIQWARLELETKGMVARGLANLLVSTDNWGGAFLQMVNGMAQINECKSWLSLLPYGVTPIGIPKLEKQTDTEYWIDKQVISAIAKHFIEHPNSVAIQRLRDMLDLLERQNKIDKNG